jgi:hypothetical protein
LHFFWPESDWDETLRDEENSMAARNLFADSVDNQYGRNNAEDNLFAAFLTKMLGTLDISAQTVCWASASTPHYRKCSDEAKKLVGDNEDAVEAILGGAAAPHQMPREIRNASPRRESRMGAVRRSATRRLG